MKMTKYIKTGIAAMLALAVTGCEGFLDEDLKSELAPTNTFTSTYGFEVGSTGLYTIARSEYNTWGSSAFMHNGACVYEALQIGTDLTDIGAVKDASITPFAYLTMTPSTTFVKSYWNWSYSLIGAANEVLIYSEMNNNWDYPTDKTRFQAEARFFRAYAYRTLVYLYGDVTWNETISEKYRIDFTRDPKEEIIGHIIDDLKFASEYLPQNPDDSKLKQGKLTKWAAEHLLSEMYLLQGNYTEAQKSAQRVIDSKYYKLMDTRFGAKKDQPGDVFSDLFVEYNQNRSSGNQETIWALQFEYKTAGGGDAYDDWTRRAWNPQYYSISGFTLADTLGGRGLAQMVPMKWWMGDVGTIAGGTTPGIFTATDIRNSNYNIKRKWYYNNPAVPGTLGKQCNITDATWFTACTLFPALVKFFYGKDDDLSYMGSNKDRMKFRLAETYLLLCEAYLMAGDTENAAKAINNVRRRALAPEFQASDMTMDVLLEERIRELAGEESRRFTLVRTGTLISRVKKYNTYQKDLIKDWHALWPIPQEVRDANKGADYPQNDGYDN